MSWRTAMFVVALLGAAYLLVALYLFVAQRRFLYPGTGTTEVERAPPGFRLIEIITADGLRLRAAFRPGRPGAPTFVFFHGNGDSYRGGAVATDRLAAAGAGVLLPEYCGYNGNPGSPDEAGLYADGRAALDWLATHGVPVARTVLIGNSLGSGVATELARERPVAGLVLISGFTSLPDVVAEHFAWLPARLLVRARYRNEAKLAAISRPVLVLHGDADTLIPVRHALALGRAAPHASVQLFAGVGHDLAYRPDAQAAISRWVEGLSVFEGHP